MDVVGFGQIEFARKWKEDPPPPGFGATSEDDWGRDGEGRVGLGVWSRYVVTSTVLPSFF